MTFKSKIKHNFDAFGQKTTDIMVDQKIASEEVVVDQLETTSQIYVFGSGECEQLGKSAQLFDSFVKII